LKLRHVSCQARWTFEAAQDAQSMHGIDVEAEIMAALAQEITVEIDQEVLFTTSLAATDFTYNQATVSGTATFVGDEHAALAVLINRVANLIAQRTRRGAGNWAVVSPAFDCSTICYNFCFCSHYRRYIRSSYKH
jgi:hypothetical protein